MYDVKRRFQNFEDNLLDSTYQQPQPSSAYRRKIRQERFTQIRQNVKNLHFYGYFVLLLLFCLYLVRLACYHVENESSGKPLEEVSQQGFDPTFSIYSFDFSSIYNVFGQQQQQRSTFSKLPQQLSSLELCDFDRLGDDVLTAERFQTKYENAKPLILFFYGDLNAWSYHKLWSYSSLNSTFKDTIVQFGRSADSNYEMRETTFGNFLQNLIGQTDLRGEPWQIRDGLFLTQGKQDISNKWLKDINHFKQEWKSRKSFLHLGTTLASTAFQMNPNGATVVAIVKGRIRVFLYPTSVTPPAGYEKEIDTLSWFTLIYPKLDSHSGLQPLECVIEAGEILYIPEAWFWASVNLGTTIKLVFEAENPQTEVGKLLTELDALQYSSDLNSVQQTSQKLQLWSQLRELLPETEFVKFEQAKLMAKSRSNVENSLKTFLDMGDYFIAAKLEAALILREYMGKTGEAKNLLNRTLQVVPQSDLVLRELGFLQHHQGEFEAAGDSFRTSALLSSQIEQQLEDLMRAEDNYRMTSSTAKLSQIEHIRDHFKHIAHNEYTAFKN